MILLTAILMPIVFLVLITWNTLPNSRLYPLKTGLEDIALEATSISFPMESSFRLVLINRRFKELARLIDRSSIVGFAEFVAEVNDAEESIFEHQLRNKKAAEAQARKLSLKLKGYYRQLDKERQQLTPPSTSEQMPQLPDLTVPQMVVEPEKTDVYLIIGITQTQQAIQKNISNLDKIKS